MTPKQNRVIAHIARRALEAMSTLREVEFKRWEVSAIGGNIFSVIVETGYINDDDSMLSLTRKRGHFFVGPRGSIRAVTYSKNTKQRNLRKYPLIYGFDSVL